MLPFPMLKKYTKIPIYGLKKKKQTNKAVVATTMVHSGINSTKGNSLYSCHLTSQNPP
jgi:hypothetical protein